MKLSWNFEKIKGVTSVDLFYDLKLKCLGKLEVWRQWTYLTKDWFYDVELKYRGKLEVRHQWTYFMESSWNFEENLKCDIGELILWFQVEMFRKIRGMTLVDLLDKGLILWCWAKILGKIRSTTSVDLFYEVELKFWRKLKV